MLNLTGISSLLVWGTIGVISVRFRAAWAAQGRALGDLPYRQPLFPVLPILTVVLALLMFAAQGYASIIEDPFEAKVRPLYPLASLRADTMLPQNVVATYIGVGLYALCYAGYTLYERFWLKQRTHMVPLLSVDLDTDAVWGRGEGVKIREQQALERAARDNADVAAGQRMRVFARRLWRIA